MHSNYILRAKTNPPLGLPVLLGAKILLFTLLAALGCAATPAARPNILWILGDDLGCELACYGEPGARTPHLDRLAADGMRFNRFYTTAPVCSASRSAFMTGMYAQTIHAEQHRTAKADRRPLPDGVRLLTHWFRDAGYATANLVTFPASSGLEGRGKTDWNFLFDGKAFDTADWTELVRSRPFFAQVNFRQPHRTFDSPKVIDRAAVRIPACYPEHPIAREDWAAYLDSIADLDGRVGAVLALLEQQGLADDTIVVFFGDNGRAHVRDKQFCYEGGLRVPLLIRWPKNFPAPAGFTRGTVNERLLAAIDLAPTMLAVAGAPVPATMQGRVFLGERAAPPRDYVFGGRDRCDQTVMTLRTVRDSRYRYIRNLTPTVPFLAPNKYKETQYPVWNLLKQLNAEGKLTPAQAAMCAPTQPAEELYDLAADPDQLRNLAAAAEPAHRETLQRLRAALDGWLAEIGQPSRK
jgi:N-sulfoglucosamine sulfohydrolase